MSWIRFYTHILPYRDGFALGMFDDIVADYGRVIRRLNERFGTDPCAIRRRVERWMCQHDLPHRGHDTTFFRLKATIPSH